MAGIYREIFFEEKLTVQHRLVVGVEDDEKITEIANYDADTFDEIVRQVDEDYDIDLIDYEEEYSVESENGLEYSDDNEYDWDEHLEEDYDDQTDTEEIEMQGDDTVSDMEDYIQDYLEELADEDTEKEEEQNET